MRPPLLSVVMRMTEQTLGTSHLKFLMMLMMLRRILLLPSMLMLLLRLLIMLKLLSKLLTVLLLNNQVLLMSAFERQPQTLVANAPKPKPKALPKQLSMTTFLRKYPPPCISYANVPN